MSKAELQTILKLIQIILEKSKTLEEAKEALADTQNLLKSQK